VTSSPDVTATFCATLVDEWVRLGVTHACIAPGSRSTPLALALATQPELRIEVFHDERSAAFGALGVGLATGTPAVLLCTSGTAAAHFSAAVIEADLSGVPMLVITADRPPELVDVAAPQTIDQTKLYGGAVRWFHAPGVPDDANLATWRSLGARAAAEAVGFSGRPGPVQLNLAFREPLLGTAATLPPGRDHGAPWHSVLRGQTISRPELTRALVSGWEGKRGVILAGRGCGDPDTVIALGEQLGWPVFADHRSGCAVAGKSIRHFDSVLRNDAFASQQVPDVVLRIGELPASKVTNTWVTASGAVIHAFIPPGKWVDPDHRSGAIIHDPVVLVDIVVALQEIPRPTRRFSDVWERADAAVSTAITSTLGTSISEPAIARAALAAVPSGGALVVSSSMPVRDVEWFGAHRDDIAVISNRGANGIDGVLATAIGVASTGRPTVCLLGDVALLHDSSSLTALARRSIDLTVVVTDNDGGAIFSFLPQATALGSERYEQLFGTPHGTDLIALAQAHGLHAQRIEQLGAVRFEPGVHVLVAHTERRANVALHEALTAAARAAVDTL
jgi:2-succinyl-5-enolpyruvyl-6-hydroxy-3-cyclohexene-1-carboxylate synthase